MPITFKTAGHEAKPVKGPGLRRDATVNGLLQNSWGSVNEIFPLKGTQIFQSTFGQPGSAKIESNIIPQTNGFVHTCTAAYNQHHHLFIRPDDVWIAILAQFSFYVNAHSEELRSHFVAHDGKKELIVELSGDYGVLAMQFAEMLHREVVDPELKDWILPNFSTTSQNDTITASVLMMSTLKAYFNFTGTFACGIPSVTLEGDRADWESLLARIDKLPSFGAEPTQWVEYLRPVLTRFASSFDPDVGPDLDFWSKICHYKSQFSGTTYLCGWLTAFCVWDSKGNWLGGKNIPDDVQPNPPTIDGVVYPVIDLSDVPAGFAQVDVKVVDDADQYDCLMVAGHVGSEVVGEKGDGIRPCPGWFMSRKGEPMTMEEVMKMFEVPACDDLPAEPAASA